MAGLLDDDGSLESAGFLRGLLGASQQRKRPFTMLLGGLAGLQQAQAQAAQMAQAQAMAERKMAIEEALKNAQLQQMQEAVAARKEAAEQQALDRGLMQRQYTPLPGPTQDQQPLMPRFDPRSLLGQGGSMPAVMNMLQMEQALKPEKPKTVTLSPGQQVFGEDGVPKFGVPAAPEKPPSAVQEYEYAKQQGYPGSFDQWELSRRRAGASNVSVGYGSPVAGVDAKGNPVFLQPTKDGSAPFVIPGLRPPKSAAEERSEQDTKDRDRKSRQMMSAIDDAASILGAGKATGSGLGNVVDAAARGVGVSTPGARDAARLESLSGWLVANVPRMEGPQSNFDVQNYMTMAGKIGDRTTPIPERAAALKEVKRLQQKYAAINGTQAESQQQETKVRKFNPETGRIE